MKELKNDIKTKKFKAVYLLFGNEKYLVRHYEKELLDALSNNDDIGIGIGISIDKFEGKSCLPEDIINAANSLPFFSDKRVIHIKESGLFAAGRKDASEAISAYLSNIPETTVIVFVEAEVDKRSKLYKKVNELKRAVEMNMPDERDLANWIVSVLKQGKKTIEPVCAAFLIRYTGGDMDRLYGEMQKLIAYKTEAEITGDDIESVCIKSPETKIFDLVAAIGNKNTALALEIYSNLILMKESPIMVLTMIARQFRMLLECMHLSQMRISSNDIAQRLGLRSFIVRDCIEQSRNFTKDVLVQALTDCLETDIAIKTGKTGDKLAVELLIIEYGSKLIYSNR